MCEAVVLLVITARGRSPSTISGTFFRDTGAVLFDTVSLKQYDHHGHDGKGHLFPSILPLGGLHSSWCCSATASALAAEAMRCERKALLSICLDNRMKQNGINFIIPEGNYCAELQVTLNKGKKNGKMCS